MEDDPVMADIQRKIEREKLLVHGASRMRDQANPQVRSSIDNQIREGRRNIEYLEGRLRELQMRRMNDGVGSINIDERNNAPRSAVGPGGRQTVTAVQPSGQVPQGQRHAPASSGQGQGQYRGGYRQQQDSHPRDEPDYGNAPAGGYSDLSNENHLMPARPPFSSAPGVGMPKGRPNYSRLGEFRAHFPASNFD